MAAAEVLREKKTDEQGNVREMVIWQVRPNPRQPEGIRYRLALILAGEKEPAVLYDNHHPKRTPSPYRRVEEPYQFVDVDRLIADFMADMMRVTGARE